MRMAITIFILLIVSSSYGQRKSQASNQKEELSWTDNNARKFFKENYKQQNHQPFAGKISTLAKGIYKYNNDIIITNDTTKVNQCLFEKGLLHSGLFGGGRDTIEVPISKPMTANQKAFYAFTRTDTLYISIITELSFLHTSTKKKRFKFWLSRIGMANPMEYYFELTNPAAKPGTNIIDFINGSRLTFFKFYSIII